jgi:anti-sigma regulatory factor (Ser/Thr protein kinase)
VPRLPSRRPESSTGAPGRAEWRIPSDPASIPAFRHALRAHLHRAGVGEDQAYDLLLAACEAATNAVEHAQDPTEPFVDVTATVAGDRVHISVRDYGQWRERMPSMDRGRGSSLMTAVGEITATPSPEGTTVVISAALEDPAA